MRSNKVLTSIALSAMMVLMAMVVVLPTSVQAAWSDSATMDEITPADMIVGETYELSYTLNIAQPDGVESLTISTAQVMYPWDALPVDLVKPSAPITAFPFSYTFHNTVTVPVDADLGSQTGSIVISAYADGDFVNPTTKSFDHSFDVYSVLTATATATPTTGIAPQDVDFDVTTEGGKGSPSYSWNFGDGSAAVTQRNPTHTYTTGGTYVAKVTVSDDLGQSIVVNAPSVIIAPGVTVTITAQPSAGPFPLEVKFNSTVTNYDGDLTYAWNFGDEGTSDEASPTHTYTAAGNYQVTLTVTDSEDRTGVSDTLTVRASSSVNPVATISSTVDHGFGPLAVDFTSTVDGGTYPYTYLWNFGDGTTSTETNPSHTFSDPGVYIVKLTVTDSASRQSASSELTVTVVSDTSMRVVITASEVEGTSPMTVSFNNTILDGTAPYFYRWSFGDGVNSTLANPTHTYEKAGTYKVTLTVTDSNSNVTIAQYGLDGAYNLTVVVSEPAAAEIAPWVWIWGVTGITIVAVGAIGFVLMRRQTR